MYYLYNFVVEMAIWNFGEFLCGLLIMLVVD